MRPTPPLGGDAVDPLDTPRIPEGDLWPIYRKLHRDYTLGTMKIINTHTHGILDYVVGVALIAAPWLFGFAQGGAETWVPVVLGASTLLYSLLTRYELGLVKMIPFKTHLTLDLLSGVFLAASPWLFGFSHIVYLPHLLVGLFEIFAAVSTRTVPDSMSQTRIEHRA